MKAKRNAPHLQVVRSPVQLTEWSVGHVSGKSDAYRAPEQGGLVLRGRAQGHPKHRDGRRVMTSHIVKVNGRTITTVSGSVYELVGDPEPQYLEFLESIGKKYDRDNPIKVVK